MPMSMRDAGGGGTRHFDADLRDPDAIEAMMAAVAAWSGGGIDILVNNAGIQHAVPLHEMPVQKWNDIIAINLSSAFHTMRAGDAGWPRAATAG
jgi:3-hydroxybutyrate dehydrogenase